MAPETLTEMERDCLARILKRLCESSGLRPDDVFKKAAFETAGNFGDKEMAPELLSGLRLT